MIDRHKEQRIKDHDRIGSVQSNKPSESAKKAFRHKPEYGSRQRR